MAIESAIVPFRTSRSPAATPCNPPHQASRCQRHDSLGGVRLVGLELEAVEFEEDDASHKARPLVAVGERMVADDASGVKGGHFDDVRHCGIGVVLAGTRKRRLQKAPVAQPSGAAMERQKPVVDREHIALFDPEWFFPFHFVFYFERACRVLR